MHVADGQQIYDVGYGDTHIPSAERVIEKAVAPLPGSENLHRISPRGATRITYLP